MNKFIMAVIAATFALAMGGCAKEEGSMEKMGKSVDEAAEAVEKSADEAAASRYFSSPHTAYKSSRGVQRDTHFIIYTV